MSSDKKCPNCGACKECGAKPGYMQPYPYPVPYPIPNFRPWPYYPYQVTSGSGANSTSGSVSGTTWNSGLAQ